METKEQIAQQIKTCITSKGLMTIFNDGLDKNIDKITQGMTTKFGRGLCENYKKNFINSEVPKIEKLDIIEPPEDIPAPEDIPEPKENPEPEKTMTPVEEKAPVVHKKKKR